MPTLPILEFPDARLRLKTKPVIQVDKKIRKLADDMLETMYEAKGIGLAATQVNAPSRVIVIDLSPDQSEPLVLINPVFEVLIDDRVASQEGCLSVPGFYEPVERFERIRVKFLDTHGEQQTMEADSLLGACIQHECDHLDGKLFVDYLSNLKRRLIRRKLEKKHRIQA